MGEELGHGGRDARQQQEEQFQGLIEVARPRKVTR